MSWPPFVPVLLHGATGNWDEVALAVLAPVVIGAFLWVTRRRPDGEDDGGGES
jgi:hypothetical protein